MQQLYSFCIFIYGLFIRLSALFHPKAAAWINGRKHLFNELEKACIGNDRWVWFHCASLGEFEQGRPVIEAFRAQHKEYKLLLTFFSPSGYEVRKNYESADFVCYLPLDTPSNARHFLNIVRPELSVFVKYDFWLNFFMEMFKRKVPLHVISASFRPHQHFFHWYGSWHRAVFKCCTRIFVQDELSAALLKSVRYNNVIVSGDTRFDRVYQISQTPEPDLLVEAFAKNARVLIAGSTWPKDEQIIINWFKETDHNLKLLIAPHNVDKSHLDKLMNMLPEKSLMLSQSNQKTAENASILVIDSIGKLSHLYSYGYIAYVGGGFGAGIHNILEPAAFGLPILFGPAFKKFREAYDLIERGGAFAFSDYAMFKERMRFLLSDDLVSRMASEMSRFYVREKRGALQNILTNIQPQQNA